MTLNVSNYLKRFGLNNAIRNDRDSLFRLVSHHVFAVPFENLDPLSDLPVSLALADIEEKIVYRNRGGYCFEHATLLLSVLSKLGFETRPYSARVRYMVPRERTPPRTHLFIGVPIDAIEWMIDVGLGGGSLTLPIQLHLLDLPQKTTHEDRRINRDASDA